MPSHCFTWLITDQLAVPIVQNYGRQGFFQLQAIPNYVQDSV